MVNMVPYTYLKLWLKGKWYLLRPVHIIFLVRSGLEGPLFAGSDRTPIWDLFFSSNLYPPFCRDSVIPFMYFSAGRHNFLNCVFELKDSYPCLIEVQATETLGIWHIFFIFLSKSAFWWVRRFRLCTSRPADTLSHSI